MHCRTPTIRLSCPIYATCHIKKREKTNNKKPLCNFQQPKTKQTEWAFSGATAKQFGMQLVRKKDNVLFLFIF